ncbi:hypothetical protein RCL1_008014 [Eukaryota sp. TZLM3-RCL]
MDSRLNIISERSNTPSSPSQGETHHPISTNSRDLDEAFRRYNRRENEPDACNKLYIVKELLEGRPFLLSEAGRLLNFDGTDIETAKEALKLPVMIYNHQMLKEGPLLLPGNKADLAFALAKTVAPKYHRGPYKCSKCGEFGHTKNQCTNSSPNQTGINTKRSRKRKSDSSG